VDLSALWTGAEVIIWGGAAVEPGGPVNVAAVPLNDGAVYELRGSGS
jgi:hypothetical protein